MAPMFQLRLKCLFDNEHSGGKAYMTDTAVAEAAPTKPSQQRLPRRGDAGGIAADKRTVTTQTALRKVTKNKITMNKNK